MGERFNKFDDIKCVNCVSILGDEEDVIEQEFDNCIRKFCSDKCAEEFALKRSKLY